MSTIKNYDKPGEFVKSIFPVNKISDSMHRRLLRIDFNFILLYFVSHLEIDFEIVQVHGFFDALGPKRASTCCWASNEWPAHDQGWGHLKPCPTMCGRSKSAIINENGIGPTLIYTLCFILIEFHKLLSALKSILLFILFLAKNKTKYLFLSNQKLTPTFCMKWSVQWVFWLKGQ